MASYARMADDDTLYNMARRIQARAVRLCGELLKQIDGRGRPLEYRGDTLPVSQTQAANDAGMSEHQRKTAVRVANVPAEDFRKLQSVEEARSIKTTVTWRRIAGTLEHPRQAQDDTCPKR